MEFLSKYLLKPYGIAGCLAIALVASLFFVHAKENQINDLQKQKQTFEQTIASLQSKEQALKTKNSDLKNQINSLTPDSGNGGITSSIRVTSLSTPYGMITDSVNGSDIWDVDYTLTNTSSQAVYNIDCSHSILDSSGQTIGTYEDKIPEIDPGESVVRTLRISCNSTSATSDNVQIDSASLTQ